MQGKWKSLFAFIRVFRETSKSHPFSLTSPTADHKDTLRPCCTLSLVPTVRRCCHASPPRTLTRLAATTCALRASSLPAPAPVAAIPRINADTPSSHTSSRVHGAGFIACQLIKTLVANGHTVRGTVRDVAKDGAHLTSLGATVAEVKDLTNEEALAKALAGVDGVFHMAAVHPEYGFADTPEGRTSMLATAVEGTVAVLSACQKAGVKRVVLTSSLAAIECGNDEGTLTEAMWSKAEVYDSDEKLKQTQWTTHYTYVKSKVDQERAALAFATKAGLDMRVVVPGNLCIGPIATRDNGINGTMTRIRDIMSGKNTLKGAADLAIVHVQDVVDVHCKCMTEDAAKGRYIVAADMAPIADVFAALKEMYPQLPVAEMGAEMDIASGVLGKARKVESRAVTELGLQFKPYQVALKDSVDSMIAAKLIGAAA